MRAVRPCLALVRDFKCPGEMASLHLFKYGVRNVTYRKVSMLALALGVCMSLGASSRWLRDELAPRRF